MGDSQRVPYEQLISEARERFEDGKDFTVAVEEEFALLEPETLGLTNRFEELQAASVGTDLEPHLVGELIASEVEVRTGRCDTFGEAAARMGERRRQLTALADSLGIALGGLTGGLAFGLTGGDLQTAETVWVTSMGGTYVITPSMVQGQEPIVFTGTPSGSGSSTTADTRSVEERPLGGS